MYILYSTLESLYPPYIIAPANGPSMNLDRLSSKDLGFPQYCLYVCIFAGGNAVDVNISIQDRTITDENDDVQISQEWWILKGISDSESAVQNSSDVIMVFYSQKINQPIFSFVTGLG